MGACFHCLVDNGEVNIIIEKRADGSVAQAYSLCDECVARGPKFARDIAALAAAERQDRIVEGALLRSRSLAQLSSNDWLRAEMETVASGPQRRMSPAKEHAMINAVQEALLASDGDHLAAGEMLGMSRATVWRWRKRARDSGVDTSLRTRRRRSH